MKKEDNRIPTGILGFDKLCQGGLVLGSSNVIMGGPGTGKTTFLLQFLYNGYKEYGENGLYVSFEPDKADLLETGKMFGWDLEKLDKEGKVMIMKTSPKESVGVLKSELEKIIKSNKIKRICIDPVNVLAINLEKDKFVRESIFDLATALKTLGVTSMLSAETTEGSMDGNYLGNDDSRTQMIKFLGDAITNLYSSGLGGSTDRAIRIEKMRRTNHVRGPNPLKISDSGIVISNKL